LALLVPNHHVIVPDTTDIAFTANVVSSGTTDTIQIELFGDSIMCGRDPDVAAPLCGVCDPIDPDTARVPEPPARLLEIFLPQYKLFITTRSQGNSTSGQLLNGTDGVNDIWPDNIEADIVIINHGMNDAKAQVPVEKYKQNLISLRQGLRPTQIMVWQTPTVNKYWDTSVYASAMREVAAIYGDLVADAHEFKTSFINDIPDGLHPRQLGYAKLVDLCLSPKVNAAILRHITNQIPANTPHKFYRRNHQDKFVLDNESQVALSFTPMSHRWVEVYYRDNISFRAVSRGSYDTGGILTSGVWDAKTGKKLVSTSRSYNLVKIRREDGKLIYNKNFDVYGDVKESAALAAALNATSSDYIVVITTYDEPKTNRSTVGLLEAMYRCGASPEIFAATLFKFRSSYILVGIPGCGPGKGIEAYSGQVDATVPCVPPTPPPPPPPPSRFDGIYWYPGGLFNIDIPGLTNSPIENTSMSGIMTLSNSYEYAIIAKVLLVSQFNCTITPSLQEISFLPGNHSKDGNESLSFSSIPYTIVFGAGTIPGTWQAQFSLTFIDPTSGLPVTTYSMYNGSIIPSPSILSLMPISLTDPIGSVAAATLSNLLSPMAHGSLLSTSQKPKPKFYTPVSTWYEWSTLLNTYGIWEDAISGKIANVKRNVASYLNGVQAVAPTYIHSTIGGTVGTTLTNVVPVPGIGYGTLNPSPSASAVVSKNVRFDIGVIPFLKNFKPDQCDRPTGDMIVIGKGVTQQQLTALGIQTPITQLRVVLPGNSVDWSVTFTVAHNCKIGYWIWDLNTGITSNITKIIYENVYNAAGRQTDTTSGAVDIPRNFTSTSVMVFGMGDLNDGANDVTFTIDSAILQQVWSGQYYEWDVFFPNKDTYTFEWSADNTANIQISATPTTSNSFVTVGNVQSSLFGYGTIQQETYDIPGCSWYTVRMFAADYGDSSKYPEYYPVLSGQPGWSLILNTYGIWQGDGDYTWDFFFPVSGDYTFNASIDNVGIIYIKEINDPVTVHSYEFVVGVFSYALITTATKFIKKGWHTIKINAINAGGAGGIGATIQNNNGDIVWTTYDVRNAQDSGGHSGVAARAINSDGLMIWNTRSIRNARELYEYSTKKIGDACTSYCEIEFDIASNGVPFAIDIFPPVPEAEDLTGNIVPFLTTSYYDIINNVPPVNGTRLLNPKYATHDTNGIPGETFFITHDNKIKFSRPLTGVVTVICDTVMEPAANAVVVNIKNIQSLDTYVHRFNPARWASGTGNIVVKNDSGPLATPNVVSATNTNALGLYNTQLRLNVGDSHYSEAMVLSQPHHGYARITDNRRNIAYVPFPDYSGPDSFTYTLLTQTGQAGPPKSMYINVVGTITINQNAATFSKTILADHLTEGPKTIIMSIQSAPVAPLVSSIQALAAGPIVANVTITINDTSLTPEVYNIAPDVTTITESGTVTYTVTTTGVASGTSFYWTLGGTMLAADFNDNQSSGSVVIQNNSATFVRVLAQDQTTEGTEYLIISLHSGSVTGPVVATAATVTVTDTSRDPTYSIIPDVT